MRLPSASNMQRAAETPVLDMWGWVGRSEITSYGQRTLRKGPETPTE